MFWPVWRGSALDHTRSERQSEGDVFPNIRNETHCVLLEKPVIETANCAAANVINGYSRIRSALDYEWASDPDQGLPDEVLNNTDVLLWWGHMNHGEVKDDLVERIRQRVYVGGMGFIALHSAHHSKPFRAIVGTTGNLLWGDNQKEIIWNIMPSHPIAAGIPAHFELPEEELYAEPFQIPQPDAHIFEGWYEHGYVFRTGCTFLRGAGRVFYFQPGHETCPSFYDANVQRIITNGVRWAAPNDFGYEIESGCPYVTALV